MNVRQVHRIPVLAALITLTAMIVAAPGSAELVKSTPPADQAQSPESSRYIVALEDSVARPGRVAERHSENRDARVSHVYSHVLNGYAAEIDKDQLAAIRKDPTVAFIEPDGPGGVAAQTVPTGIDRIFVTGNKTLDIDEEDDLRVDANVAVIDSGVYAHPDLNLVGHVDCYYQECTKGGTDGFGHGTHVAGTIGALDNGIGVVGAAPGVKIWGVQVLGSTGSGELSHYLSGIDWVTSTRTDGDPENDIDVANSSLRYYCCESSEAFNKALADSLATGVVHVSAAGNESEAVRYVPGVHPDEITVSALDDYDGMPGSEEGEDPLAEFSNYGPPIDIAAPGTGILSTYPGGLEYRTFSGTSVAAPHVTGAAAILAAADRPESKEDVEDIRDTLVEAGNLNWQDTSPDGIQEPLLDVNDEGVFDAAHPPSVMTTAASEVTSSTASLNATISPRGSETTYQLEYGTTTSYGSKVPASPKSIGAGVASVKATEAIAELTPSTTYHFRVVASNAGGTSTGEDLTFTTAAPPKPKATTHYATETNGEGGTLVGFVNPEGTSTTYQIEYGKTTSYGSKVPASPKGVGSGTSNVEVSEQVSGLEPGSYHYRVVATNAGGTSYGADRTFGVSLGFSTSIACPKAELCFRVGAFGGIEGGPNTPVETWDGSQWSQETVPLPEGVTAGSINLRDISCASSTSCVAVGNIPQAMHWNGSEWSFHAISVPTGKGYSPLSGVSCTSASACTAVGWLGDGNAQVHRWNGTSWSTQSFPKELEGETVYLEDVSCPSASACVAVGVASYGVHKPVVGSWNGSNWSLQEAVNPYSTELQSVSCTSASACTAVGSYSGEEGPTMPMVERWNGSSWTQQSTPSLPGAVESYLYGVSCPTASSCKAVGMSNGETLYGLVESWNGTNWTQQSTPLPEFVWLEDVSCSAAESCVATGFGSQEGGWYPVSAAWDGSEWTQMG